jgi:hypothetical protein
MRAARACPHARKARPATVALACISFCGLNRDKSPMNQRTGRSCLQSPQKTAWPRQRLSGVRFWALIQTGPPLLTVRCQKLMKLVL